MKGIADDVVPSGYLSLVTRLSYVLRARFGSPMKGVSNVFSLLKLLNVGQEEG